MATFGRPEESLTTRRKNKGFSLATTAKLQLFAHRGRVAFGLAAEMIGQEHDPLVGAKSERARVIPSALVAVEGGFFFGRRADFPIAVIVDHVQIEAAHFRGRRIR